MRQSVDKDSVEKLRAQWISEVKMILKSERSSKDIAQKTGINLHMVYEYRNGKRDIEKARLETLVKLLQIKGEVEDQ